MEQLLRFVQSTTRRMRWLATLEVFAVDAGAQPEAQELPFEGISLDSGDGEPASVIISFGKSPSDHVTHTIHQATNLWLQQTAEGADASLEIKAGDNSNTLLRFRSPMLPEFVDGIV